MPKRTCSCIYIVHTVDRENSSCLYVCLYVCLCACVCVCAFACFLHVCYPVHVCINLMNLCVVKIHSIIQRSRPFLYAIPWFVDRCMGNTPSPVIALKLRHANKTYTQLANVKGLYSKGFHTLKPKQIRESPHFEFQLPTKNS